MSALPNIPDEVWSAHPLLKELRAEAHRRCVGADAVLWSFLVSVAAYIPPRVAIDTGIGVPVRPTLFAVLAGASGTGKSQAWSVARALLPGTPEPLPLSTGEGLIEAFYDNVLDEQPQPPKPDGEARPPKMVWVRRRVRSNVLFWSDEAETLFKQMERPGNILGPVLRSFWSGGTVGQANATREARRGLDAGSYTGGLVVGLQPDISGRLLADTSTGTAQRFVWAASTDVHLRDEVEPAAFRPPGLAWTPPPLPGAPTSVEEFFAQPSPGQPWTPPPELPPVTMRVDGEIAAEIRRHQIALRRGDVEPDEHDSQRTAAQVKVAGVLAWLDGQLAVSAEHWQLAGELLAASDRVRDALLDHAEWVVHRERTERGVERAQISQAETVAEVMRKRCRERLITLLTERESVTHAELRRSVTTAQRPFMAEALDALVSAEAVTVEEAPSGGRRYAVALAEGGDGGDAWTAEG